jgi:hypothetical protein
MAITLQQAQQAGQIAANLENIASAIVAIQTALTGQWQINSLSASTPQGQLSFGGMTLSVADSATVLNAALTVLQNNQTALNAVLAGM